MDEKEKTLYATPSKQPYSKPELRKITHEEAQAMRNVLTDLADCRVTLFEILAHARQAQSTPEYAKDNCVCIDKLANDCLARTANIISQARETKEKSDD